MIQSPYFPQVKNVLKKDIPLEWRQEIEIKTSNVIMIYMELGFEINNLQIDFTQVAEAKEKTEAMLICAQLVAKEMQKIFSSYSIQKQIQIIENAKKKFGDNMSGMLDGLV